MGLIRTPGAQHAIAREPGAATPAVHRVPALDGIRGIAILWVMLHNTLDLPDAPLPGPLHILAVLAHPGWIGVQLFFGLSGFLITAGLLETRTAINYFQCFYFRRAVRILPLYYGVLAIMLVIVPLAVARPLRWQSAVDHPWSLWLFIVNWTHVSGVGFGHFWSLAVEEQFYLVWPFLVRPLRAERLLPVCGVIAVCALVSRCILAALGASGWTLYTATVGRMDALALGAAGACLLHVPAWREWLRTRSRQLLLGGAAVFLGGAGLTRLYDTERLLQQTLGYTILALCCALLVTVIASRGSSTEPRCRSGADAVSALLAWAPLRACGRYSYAMYIFHEMLHKLIAEPWIAARFGTRPPLAIAVASPALLMGASFVLGWASYHLLEQHFLALKRYCQPRYHRTEPSAHG